MERIKLVLVVLFVVLAFSVLFGSIRQTTIADETAAGLLTGDAIKPAPDFTLPDAVTGQTVNLLTETKKQPVVIDFWATWCGPCQAELPHLQAISEKYAGRVVFYGINSDDPPAVVAAFAKHSKLTFPMLSDLRKDAAFHYGADAIPLLVVIDRQGKVRAVTQGYDDDIDTHLPKVLDVVLAN